MFMAIFSDDIILVGGEIFVGHLEHGAPAIAFFDYIKGGDIIRSVIQLQMVSHGSDWLIADAYHCHTVASISKIEAFPLLRDV